MSMDNDDPSYYHNSAPVRSLVQHQEHVFDLYAHQLHGNDGNEHMIAPQRGRDNHFGATYVVDWEVRDGGDTGATLVGRLQGVIAAASKSSGGSWYASLNLVFTDKSFKGSTLSLQGPLGPLRVGVKGDWVVAGGTRDFVYAQGVCTYERIIHSDRTRTINKLHIRVVCLTFPKPNPVHKTEPRGGNGETAYELQDAELPQRLQSLTIYAEENSIQSIAFSYIDQAGKYRTVGPWGGDDGMSDKEPVHIQFDSSESVKKVYGSTRKYDGGNIVVTSLTIVTNIDKPYGPYGKQSDGDHPFHIVPPSNDDNIVGFFGRAGKVVNQIGAYYVSQN